MILQLKGNSGSGKTTVTRQFMALGPRSKVITSWEAWGPNAAPRLSDYRVMVPGCARPWIVLGTYENICGGADKIKSSAEVIERIEFYNGEGYNVWFEGLLLSTTYGAVGAYSAKYGNNWLFAYLDTPIEVCLTRIQQRRDAEGNTKPFNPAKTIKRHRAVTILNRERTEIEEHRRCITVPYMQALETLMPIIRAEG